MTVSLYSGTPGSGKSLSMAQEVCLWLKSYKKNVIANTMISREKILKGKEGGQFFYVSNEDLTPDYLYKYALSNHKIGIESQTLIVIDEAQCKFSPTACKLFSQEDKNYRQNWLEFFTQHRHLGYDILLISQFDKLIDAQLRCLFEYNYVHRKANNFRTIGKLLTIFHITFFCQIQHWYGAREVCGSRFFFYRKKYGEIYDSYSYRTQIIEKLTEKYGEKVMQELMGFKRPSKKKEIIVPKDKKETESNDKAS